MAKLPKFVQNAWRLVQNGIAGFSPNTGPDFASSRVGLFASTVDVNTIRDIYKRDELTYAAVNRLASDVFDNWADITVLKANGTANDLQTDKLNDLLDKLYVQKVMRQAFITRLVHGVSVIGIGFGGDLNIPAEPGEPDYISNVPWPWIKNFLIDLDPGSEFYGRVSKVVLHRPVGDTEGKQLDTQEVRLDKTRCVHWPMGDLDGNNPFGMSALLPLADMLTVKKNIDWSSGEIPYQYGSKHYVFQFPGQMPDAQYTAAKESVKDFNALATFTYRGEPIDIKAFGGEGQLNLEPYTRYITSLISIGLRVPYPMLFRGLTGGVSDIVQQDYASDIAAIQTNEVEPALRELLNKMGWDTDLIEIEWNAILEMTEKDRAFITSRKALARNLEAKAMGFYLSSGLAVELDDDGHILRVFDPDKKDNILYPPEVESGVPGQGAVPIAPVPVPGQPAPLLPPKPQPGAMTLQEDPDESILIKELVEEEAAKKE